MVLVFLSARGSYNYLQASGGTYLRPTTAGNRGIYIGQASSTSSGILMVASGDTTIDFSAPGTTYKGRIQYDNTSNSLKFFTNSSATPSFVLTDAATANIIICNLFEPTTVNTEMIIKANNVLWGDTITHTLLSSATSQFFSGVVFNKPVQFLDGIDLGSYNADGTYTSTCIISKQGMDTLMVILVAEVFYQLQIYTTRRK